MDRRQQRDASRRKSARPEPKMLRLPDGWLVPVMVSALVLVGLALRASDLRADPPPDLSWSFAPYTDEALNTYSARNLILYGSWKVDDFFPFVVYPLVNLLAALVFWLFGIGFVQVKLISVLAGVASIGVLYLLVKDAAGRMAGLFAALGTAVCFPLVMYSRLGLVEPLQILFLLLTGLFYCRGLVRPRLLMVLSGLFGAGTVLLVKISAVFVLPVMAVMFAWQFVEAGRDSGRFALMRRAIGWWLVGAAGTIFVWLGLVFLPHRAEYFQYVLRHSLESPAGHPSNLAAYVFNTFTVGVRARFISRLAFTALVGFLFLPGFGLGKRPGMRFLFTWFVFGLVMLGYMNYRPPRYETILLPPLIAVAAAALSRFLEQGVILTALRPRFLKSLLFSLWLWPLVVQLALYTNGFWATVRPRTEPGLLAVCFGICLGLVVLGYVALGYFKAGLFVRPVAVRVALAALFLMLVLRLDFVQYFDWFRNRSYRLIESGQDIDRVLPEKAVLAGNWAPELLLGSRKRALAITDWANTRDPVARFGVTHLVSVEGGYDENLFRQQYPELMAQARELRRYQIRGVPVKVYELTVFP